MKISEIRIDGRVMTKTGRIGRVTGALDTGRIYVLFGSDEYPSRMFAGELEPVSDPCQFVVGDKVRATGKSIYGADIEGKTFEVVDPDYHSAEHGDVVRLNGGYLVKPENLVKCDPCAGCQKLAESYREGRKDEWRDNRPRIAELRRSRDEWEATAYRYCRNAAYWREELTKLQKEALAECDEKHIHPASHIEDFRKKPLAEAAKIYIQISPEVLERILKERD